MEKQKKKQIRKKFENYLLNAVVYTMIAGLIIFLLSNRIFYNIHSGEKGVMFMPLQEGTQLDTVYGEGFHMIAPWNDLIIYDVRQKTESKFIKVLTSDGLRVSVELAFRYFPARDSLAILHQELGPEYLNTVVYPEIESAIRTVIADYDEEKLYASNRNEIENEVRNTVQIEFESLPIHVHDIMVKDIALPSSVAKAIEEKRAEKQKYLTFFYTLKVDSMEAHRKLVEARGIRQFTDTSNIDILKWRGLEATEKLATSPNSKVIIMGTSDQELPVILGGSN